MFNVQVLGISAAVPAMGRGVSAQVVSFNDKNYLIDCGEATQIQLNKFRVKVMKIDAIFISHLHGDHVFGLPGLLSSMSMDGRSNPLYLFAPAALKDVLELILKQTNSYLSYKLEFIPIEDFPAGEPVFITDNLRVSTIPLLHRIFCRGYKFEEINKKPKFDFYKAKALEIPNQYFHLLKQGNPVTLENGNTIYPEQVLLPADIPRSYAYCSDTAYFPSMIPHIHGCSLLYHEATFGEEHRLRAKETFHSTAKEAAMIAKKAKVKQLILGHFSARYKDLTPLIEEAAAVFPAAEAAEEGKIYSL